MPADFFLGFLSGALTGVFGSVITAYLTERRRLRFVPVGPTLAEDDGSWLFYYEFKPVVGILNERDSAAEKAGGSVHLKTSEGYSRHHAESYWAGVPMAGSATIYAKRGILVLQVYPKSHMVLFYSAGTAPHADQLKIGPGARSFDWDTCRKWLIEITVSSPESAAGTVKTTVEDLYKEARGTQSPPPLSPIVSDASMVEDGMLVKGAGDAIYLIDGKTKRLIPDIPTFLSNNFQWRDILRISDTVLAEIHDGANIIYILR